MVGLCHDQHDRSKKDIPRLAREDGEHPRWARDEGERPHLAKNGQETLRPTKGGRGAPRLDQEGRNDWLDEDREDREPSMRRSRSLRDQESTHYGSMG